MRIASVLKVVGVGSAVAGTTLVAAQRLVLRKVDRTPPPDGWVPPRWPNGTVTTVTTDDGAELLVESTGPTAAPAVVLVHGLTGDHHSLGPIADVLLAQGFRVVGVNQRGHGGSSVGSEGFGPARQGTDVGQVLATLDLRDVTLVGHSMGGVAAMSLLTLAPDAGADRVGSLVLVATLADSMSADREASLKIEGTTFYRRLRRNPDVSAAIGRWIFGPTPSRAELAEALEVSGRCPEETAIGAALGLVDYDIRGLLADIDTPTIVVCGTRDIVTRHRENQAIADVIPGAQFRSVEGAGHMVVWENPNVIVEAIVELARARRSVRT